VQAAGSSLYDLLHVAETATASEVKAAWRRRLLMVHPDHGGSVAATIEVQGAYEVLSDPLRRREYDRELEIARSAASGAETSEDAATRQNSDLADLLSRMQYAAAAARAAARSDHDPSDTSWEHRWNAEDDERDWDLRSRTWARSASARAGVFLCAGTTRSGRPCLARPRKGSKYCYVHDPIRTQRRCPGLAGPKMNRPCRGIPLADSDYCWWHTHAYHTKRAPRPASTTSGFRFDAAHPNPGTPRPGSKTAATPKAAPVSHVRRVRVGAPQVRGCILGPLLLVGIVGLGIWVASWLLTDGAPDDPIEASRRRAESIVSCRSSLASFDMQARRAMANDADRRALIDVFGDLEFHCDDLDDVNDEVQDAANSIEERSTIEIYECLLMDAVLDGEVGDDCFDDITDVLERASDLIDELNEALADPAL
jgi:hypothetical protein